MNAETWFQVWGFYFKAEPADSIVKMLSDWHSTKKHGSSCSWSLWTRLTKWLLSPAPPKLSFYFAWDTSSWQCFEEVRSPYYYCPSAWFPRLFCLEHIGLTYGSCQICLAICKTAHLLTKQVHKYPIYLWRKVVCFVLYCIVVMRSTKPGCFRSCFWCLWKALDKEEGCMGLVPRCLDLRCKSSWILNDFFTKN
jgi:hypothetical protein